MLIDLIAKSYKDRNIYVDHESPSKTIKLKKFENKVPIATVNLNALTGLMYIDNGAFAGSLLGKNPEAWNSRLINCLICDNDEIRYNRFTGESKLKTILPLLSDYFIYDKRVESLDYNYILSLLFFNQPMSGRISRTKTDYCLSAGMIMFKEQDSWDLKFIVTVDEDYLEDYKCRLFLGMEMDNSKFHLYMRSDVLNSKTPYKRLRSYLKTTLIPNINSENYHSVDNLNDLFIYQIDYLKNIKRLDQQTEKLAEMSSEFIKAESVKYKFNRNGRIELTH